jgi:hypothetical protein
MHPDPSPPLMALMICDSCQGEHEVMGKLLVDEVLIPAPWVEILVEPDQGSA